ncbi:MAG: hypothetical protein WDN69_34695 [Aliidongia sp.]
MATRPRHLALIVDGFRGTLDVTVHGGLGIANSFDLYLPDPAQLAGMNSSVSFHGAGEPDGEERMIVFVGIRPGMEVRR